MIVLLGQDSTQDPKKSVSVILLMKSVVSSCVKRQVLLLLIKMVMKRHFSEQSSTEWEICLPTTYSMSRNSPPVQLEGKGALHVLALRTHSFQTFLQGLQWCSLTPCQHLCIEIIPKKSVNGVLTLESISLFQALVMNFFLIIPLLLFSLQTWPEDYG